MVLNRYPVETENVSVRIIERHSLLIYSRACQKSMLCVTFHDAVWNASTLCPHLPSIIEIFSSTSTVPLLKMYHR